MTINSIHFFLFFIVVFTAYYLPVFRSSSKYQNLVLFVVSYVFYAYSDWRMLALLLGSTIVFYYLGMWLKIEIDKERWRWVSSITIIGVLLGVGILLYFKYLNFFAESIAALLLSCGFHVSWNTLHIILPIGVSFFTFKLISYILEINRESIEPTKDFVKFGTYIAFFPTIMAGPIDRPNKFIPQLEGSRSFNYPLAVDGCRQILWGMFIKMCIADNIAVLTDNAWSNLDVYGGWKLIYIVLLYPIQLYTDFAGYSDMAIGVSKLLGLRVARNFNHPLLAHNVAAFWRRWHMSLTTWVTDYVYTPLSYTFRNRGKFGVCIAIMINLVVIGLWHGANLTYLLFGLYHGLLFIPLVVIGLFYSRDDVMLSRMKVPSVILLGKIALTYLLISLGAILFRANSISHLFAFLESFHNSAISSLYMKNSQSLNLFALVLFVPALCVLEWIYRDKEYPLDFSNKVPVSIRWTIYFVLALFIYVFQGVQQDFIYFQF